MYNGDPLFFPGPSSSSSSSSVLRAPLCSQIPELGLLRAWRNQVKLFAAQHTDCSVHPSGNAKPFLPRLQRRTLPSLQTCRSIKLSPAPSTPDSLGRVSSHPAPTLAMFLWNTTHRALWSSAPYVNFFRLNLRQILANLTDLSRPQSSRKE